MLPSGSFRGYPRAMRAILLLVSLVACGGSPPSGAIVLGTSPWGSLDVETDNTCAWRDSLGLILQVRATTMLDGSEQQLNVIVRADPAAEGGFVGDTVVALRLSPTAGGGPPSVATSGVLSIERTRDLGDGGVRFMGVLRLSRDGFDLEMDIDAGGCTSNPS